MTEEALMKLIADELWSQGGAMYRRDGDVAFPDDRGVNLRSLARAILAGVEVKLPLVDVSKGFPKP